MPADVSGVDVIHRNVAVLWLVVESALVEMPLSVNDAVNEALEESMVMLLANWRDEERGIEGSEEDIVTESMFDSTLGGESLVVCDPVLVLESCILGKLAIPV